MIPLQKDKCAVVPWSPECAGAGETLLASVWSKLHQEDLYKTVFHESTDMTFAQFMQFFSRNDVAPQVLGEIGEGGMLKEIAGLTWLCCIENLPDGRRRAVGSFAFFKNYWTPRWTDTFGRLVLDYWFSPEGLAVDLLTALTPEPNRAARLYAKRQGIPYVARIDNYSTFNGKPCAVHVAVLDRQRYMAEHSQVEVLEGAGG